MPVHALRAVPTTRTTPHVRPLRERRGDWFFVLAFAFFTWSSFFSDIVPALGLPIVADSPNLLVRGVWLYAEDADPLLIANPHYMQISTFISAFVFGPFYAVLVWSFVRGWNGIRIPALMYVSAMTYGMVTFLWNEFAGPMPPTRLGWFFGWNLPYLFIPLALGWRMRKVDPFS
jgi:hypothetical protein